MKKGKIVALALAGTLTATALLAGTYAWTSISQQAKNQAKGTINPGGRLHDDFNGTNKDIYVENFTTTNEETGEKGAIIYARIKLEEYLKVGNIILDLDDDEENGPTFEEPSTWTLFELEDEDNSMYRKFFKWTWGEGETKTYLPTFNKNKDSLEADVNGTYEGDDRNETLGKPYDNYVVYEAGAQSFETADAADGTVNGIVPSTEKVGSKFGIEIYDCDDDDRDEDKYLNEAIIETFHAGEGKIIGSFDGTNPIDRDTYNTVTLTGTNGEDVTAKVINIEKTGVDIVALELDLPTAEDVGNGEIADEPDVRIEAVTATHGVKTTLKTLGVITMEEWKAMGCPEDAYWVYDTDGWAYWAKGIEPGEATGCLLTAIEPTGSIVDAYHYAINVTAEFATAGDWGESAEEAADNKAKGFYVNGITGDGLYLLNTIAGAEKDIVITASDSSEVKPGEFVDLTSTVMLGLQTLDDAVTWTLDDPENPNTGKSSNTKIVLTEVNSGDGERVKVGRLTIGEDETLKSVVVTAYLTANPDVKTTKRIYVDELLEVTVALADENVANLVVPENITTLALKSTVKNQWNEEQTSGVTWSLVEGTYEDKGTSTATEGDEGEAVEEDADYTYISEDGVLYIGTDETSKEIQVVATSKDESKTQSEPFTVTLNTQLEYLASISEDETKWGLADTTIKIDGINWYVLSKANVDDDEEEEVLLWATQGVTGWGGPNENFGWPYWSANFEFTAQELKDEMLALGGAENTDWTNESVIAAANWWKYSNARAWLNYSENDSKDVSEPVHNSNVPNDSTGNKGFLADKEILKNNAASVIIRTRQEYNDSNTEETKYEATPDKIFLLTQADIFGTASNADINLSEASALDYTTGIAENLLKNKNGSDAATEINAIKMRISRDLDSVNPEKNLYQWNWLRSPRISSILSASAGITSTGDLDGNNYTYANGRLRPALWMNLTQD